MPCQLYFNSRPLEALEEVPIVDWKLIIMGRYPKGSDVRPGDLVEIDAGSQWFYGVIFTERTHLDFPNEYLSCVLVQGSHPSTRVSALALTGGGLPHPPVAHGTMALTGPGGVGPVPAHANLALGGAFASVPHGSLALASHPGAFQVSLALSSGLPLPVPRAAIALWGVVPPDIIIGPPGTCPTGFLHYGFEKFRATLKPLGSVWEIFPSHQLGLGGTINLLIETACSFGSANLYYGPDCSSQTLLGGINFPGGSLSVPYPAGAGPTTFFVQILNGDPSGTFTFGGEIFHSP